MARISWTGFAAGLFAMLAASGAAHADCVEERISKKGETILQIASDTYEAGLHRQLLVNVLMQKHGLAGKPLATGTKILMPCATKVGFDLSPGFWGGDKRDPITVQVATAGYEYQGAITDLGPISLYDALLEGVLDRGDLTAEYRAAPGPNVEGTRPFVIGAASSDISFPWTRGLCSGASVDACSGLLWSDPLFEVISRVYSVTGTRVEIGAVRGGRLCIADESRSSLSGATVFAGDAITGAVSGDADSCMASLRAGAVDAAILPEISVLIDNRVKGGEPPLVAAKGVTLTDTVHAVVDASNADARTILSRLNQGLDRIRNSGEWYEIVRVQLSRGYLN